jgi:hypothetical protein
MANSYEKDFLAMRFAVMCQSGETKTKAEGYKNLILYSKKVKWTLYPLLI